MLPTGTVSFLFTDIEGSTQLWEAQPGAMRPALAEHDDCLRQAIAASHGQIVKTTGDGVHAVFATALDAIHAAIAAQRSLQAGLTGMQLKVRMGLHTGEAELREGDYYGPATQRAPRASWRWAWRANPGLRGDGRLVREQLAQDTALKDMGEHRLKGLSSPATHLWQIVAPD